MRIIKVLMIFFVICFFICIADLLQRYNILPKIIYEFKFMEIMNFLGTVFLGLFIPYFINRALDNKKLNRTFLINECNDLLRDSNELNNYLINLSLNQVVSELEKDKILFLLEKLEKKLDNLFEYLDLGNLPQDISENSFKPTFIRYWETITGGDLMNQEFSFSDEYRSLCSTSYYDLEKNIKKYILNLNRT